MKDYKHNPSERSTHIGNRIKEIREARHMTQVQLGDALGIDSVRISQYERGYRTPRPEIVSRIADVLHVSPQSITDPDVGTESGVMRLLFDMDEKYDIKLGPSGKGFFMYTDNPSLVFYLNEWYKVKRHFHDLLLSASPSEQDAIKQQYHDWKWKFTAMVLNDENGSAGCVSDEEFKKIFNELLKQYTDDFKSLL